MPAKRSKTASMSRIMSHYKPTGIAIFSFFVTAINAFTMPMYGFIFSKILFVMMGSEENYNSDRNFWCGMLLVLSVGCAITGFGQKYLFNYCGENLTFTFRRMLFTEILHK